MTTLKLPGDADIEAVVDAAVALLALRVPLCNTLSAIPPHPEQTLEPVLADFPRKEHAFLAAQAARSVTRVLVRARGAAPSQLPASRAALSEPLLDRARGRAILWLTLREDGQTTSYLVELRRKGRRWKLHELGSRLREAIEGPFGFAQPWDGEG